MRYTGPINEKGSALMNFKRLRSPRYLTIAAFPVFFLAARHAAPSPKAIPSRKLDLKHLASKQPAKEKYFSSILWCVMENHGFGQVKDLKSSRYFMRHGAVLMQYTGDGHPSGPNYRVLVSGKAWSRKEVYTHPQRTVVTELNRLGIPTLDWHLWGKPDLKHDPYRELHSKVLTVTGPLDPDQLPAHVQIYMGANDLNNAHSAPLGPVDRNFMSLINRLEHSKWFHRPDALGHYPVVAVTWDESFLKGGLIFTAFLGDGVKEGYASDKPYNHLSFCRTLTDNWGMAPLEAASNSTPIDDIWKAAHD